MAAEDTWYGPVSAPAEEQARDVEAELKAEMDKLRQAHAGETAEYLRQIGELQARLRQQEQESRQQLDHLRGEHADHLTVVQGELLDIKRELEEQQKINSLLRREVHKLQSRTTSGMG